MMKNLFFIWILIFNSYFIYAQEQAYFEIINLKGEDKVEINIDKKSDLNRKDTLLVFGPKQIIHPATGKIVEKKEAFLGKLEIIEINEIKALCKIIEESGVVTIGSKALKVSSNSNAYPEKVSEAIRFENPRNRFYSESIYAEELSLHNSFKLNSIHSEGKDLIGVICPKNQEMVKKGNKYVIKTPEYKKYISQSTRITDYNNLIGYIKVDKNARGKVVLDNGYRDKLKFVQDYNLLELFKPIELNIGISSNIASQSEDKSFLMKFGMDFYPNSNIDNCKNANNLFWIGIDGSINYLILQNIPFDYSDKSFKLGSTIEIGFSPWRDQIAGNKKLYFGISYKFMDGNYSTTRYIDGDKFQYKTIINSLPKLFLGYEFNLFLLYANLGFHNYKFQIKALEFENDQLFEITIGQQNRMSIELGLGFRL
jgi:hypothetical protein